ncbi:hypothetical protein Niako_0508 [Niastella koreensis GR20-10]|uniref:Uncharacterized protein n=1 Tax=Niastella koreensis (strain DSM 17620 / KACC 11465 / NBRC 106392 / GR20-10) TaxID=700598 RepID=G8T7W5_NIAKG|nr:hypothetical protein Niako_0508 [Niastella koreensis GR20-10]
MNVPVKAGVSECVPVFDTKKVKCEKVTENRRKTLLTHSFKTLVSRDISANK